MTINTTALEESQYLVANLFQPPISIQKTFVADDVFFFYSIGGLSNETATQWKNYSDDPEIAAMSEEEIVGAILSMAGKWTDSLEFQEGWLDELRDEWDERINDLFNLSQE